MQSLRVLLFCGLVVLPVVAGGAPDEQDYSATLRVFRESPISGEYFQNAYGYAVFPTVGKGGAVLGGAFGRGQVYRAQQVTGFCRLFQLSAGFQLGGQAFSEIIFFQDRRAYDEFTRGTFEFGAGASAVAITAGAQAQTGTTGTSAGVSLGPQAGRQLGARYVKGMAVFVHIKGGLMYEATVAGQRFSCRMR